MLLKTKISLRRQFILVVMTVLMVAGLRLPLGAQLQEAVQVPWPGFHVLEGRWQARDGRSIIDIKKISLTGNIEMQYIDLKPIRVTQAQAGRDGKVTRIRIILHYSDSLCCTYELVYNPEYDQLKGIFWQKGSGKSEDIIFNRLF